MINGTRREGRTMGAEIFRQFTRTDGSTLEISSPANQVAVLTDAERLQRLAIFEDLGVVSIEMEEPNRVSIVPESAHQGS
jgi:hypothetical protein